MLRKKSFWILILVVLVAAAGGYYYYTTEIAVAEAAEADEPAMQTATARRGDLVVFASGAGSTIPASELNLGFDESGTLIELNFGVGDKVQKGDTLARLQTNNTPEEIAVSISDAELNVLRAQQAIDELYANAETVRTNALNDISVFAQEVRDAVYQLENYTLPTYLQGLETIEALDLMKEGLNAASAAFEPFRYYPSDSDTRQQLVEELSAAQSKYDAAVKHLNYEYVYQVAQTNLDKARQDYAKYENGPAADELALAEAELANAEAKLALAQEAQTIIELVAPMDATVMAVDANVGEAISTTAIFTLADLEQPMLDVYLDETDLDKVAVGHDVEVVFDALLNNTFSGKVISVNPALETVSNVQAIKTLVILDKESLEADTVLPVGLNASVDIIAGRAENAVLVPVEALRELGPGEYAVFVVVDGEPLLRVVEVGLIDITSAEIISGLEAGEIVTTGIVQAE